MKTIAVNTSALDAQAAKLSELQRTVDGIARQVQSVKSSLSWQIAGSSRIKSQLGSYGNYLDQLGARSGALGKALADLSASYSSTENKLSGKSAGGNSGNSGGSGSQPGMHWDDVNWFSFGDLWGLVGGFGLVGNLVSMLGGLATEPDPVKRFLGLGGDASGLIGDVAKSASESKFDWFGFAKVSPGDVPKSFSEAFGKQLDKYSFGNAKSVGDKVAVGAKWAGTIFTVATTAYENIGVNEEGNSLGRAIAETAGESAVKIVGGTLLAAGASLLGGPAIVTAGVTVGAAWLINRGFEAVTGKGAAEFISDTVLDAGEKLVKNVGSAVSAAGKTIGGWWNKGKKFLGL